MMARKLSLYGVLIILLYAMSCHSTSALAVPAIQVDNLTTGTTVFLDDGFEDDTAGGAQNAPTIGSYNAANTLVTSAAGPGAYDGVNYSDNTGIGNFEILFSTPVTTGQTFRITFALYLSSDYVDNNTRCRVIDGNFEFGLIDHYRGVTTGWDQAGPFPGYTATSAVFVRDTWQYISMEATLGSPDILVTIDGVSELFTNALNASVTQCTGIRFTGSGAGSDRWHLDAAPPDFDQVTRDLTIMAGPSAAGGALDPPAGVHSYPDGERVTLIAQETFLLCPDAYEFVEWQLPGGIVDSNLSVDLVMDADMIVTAQYSTSVAACQEMEEMDLWIANAGFERPQVGIDPVIYVDSVLHFWNNNLPGWTQNDVWPQALSKLPGRFDYYPDPDGPQVWCMFDAGAELSQVLDHTFQPDSTYTLSVDFGRPQGATVGGWAARLMAGDTLVAEKTHSNTTPRFPAPGAWMTVELSHTTGAIGDPVVGRPIRIMLSAATGNDAHEVCWDNLRLRGPSIPMTLTINEPSPAVAENYLSPRPGTYQYPFPAKVPIEARESITYPEIWTLSAWSGDADQPLWPVTTVTMTGDKTVTPVYFNDPSRLAGAQCGDFSYPKPQSDFTGDCATDLSDFACLDQKWQQPKTFLEVGNPNFDVPEVPPGGYWYYPRQECAPGGWCNTGDSDALQRLYIDDRANFGSSPQSGGAYAYIYQGNYSLGHFNDIYQVLNETFVDGATYRIQVDVYNTGVWSIRLEGATSGVVVAEANQSTQSLASGWNTITAEGTAGSSVAGEHIKIFLGDFGGNGLIVDSVRVENLDSQSLYSWEYLAWMAQEWLRSPAPSPTNALPSFGHIDWTLDAIPWVPPGPNGGISGHAQVEIGGKIYLAGGFISAGDGSGDAAQRTSKWTYCYDPATQQWTQLADMPERREYTRGIATSDAMYVIGGERQSPTDTFDDCFKLDLTAQPPVWSYHSEINAVTSFQGVGRVDDLLVVIGGVEWQSSPVFYNLAGMRDTVDVLDLSDEQAGWQLRTPTPGLTAGWTASAVCQDRVYVFGGIPFNSYRDQQQINHCYYYEPKRDRWTRIANAPYQISGWQAETYVNRYMLVVGGSSNTVPGVFNEVVYVYDTQEDRWMRMDGTIAGGGYYNDCGVSIIGDMIYVTGGEGAGGSHNNYILTGQIVPNP